MRTLFFVSLLSLTTTLFSHEEIDVSQPLRIDRLFPKDVWIDRPPIDPALPDSFELLTIDNDNLSLFIWGSPEELATAYDDSPLNSPIILCAVTPLPLDVFKETGKELPSIPDLKMALDYWGDTPYYRVTVETDEGPLHSAVISLNREEKTALTVTLLSPEGKEEEAEQLWNTFFQQTKPLPFPLKMKAKGEEMHPGRTLVHVGGHSFEATAQKRKRDQQIRYTLVPQEREIRCFIDETIPYIMGDEWHHGEALLELSGCYFTAEKKHFAKKVLILIEEVDEFSPLPTLPQNGVVGEVSGS